MKKLFLLLCLSTSLLCAQAVRVDPSPATTIAATSPSSFVKPPILALPFANVSVCSYPANGVPCTNYATTYTSHAATTSCPTTSQIVLQGTTTCTSTTDAQGNFGVWIAPGTYAYTLSYGGISYGPYALSTPGVLPFGSFIPLAPSFLGPADTGISRIGPGEIAAGNGTPGDESGTWYGNSIPTRLAAIRIASQFPGSDCGAKINAADADLGSTPGEIWINQACGTSWTTPVVLSANRILRFIQGGAYQSSAAAMITVAGGSAILGGVQEGTTLTPTSATATAIALSSTSHDKIADLTIQPSGTPTAGSCISLSSAIQVAIERVFLYNCYDGITITNGGETWVANSEVREFQHDGILYASGDGSVVFSAITMDNDASVTPNAGVEIQNANGAILDGLDVIHSGSALKVDPASGQNVEWLTVLNSQFDTNQNVGILLNPASGGKIYGASFVDDWASSTTAGTNKGVLLEGAGTIDTVRFIGLRCFGNADYGMLVANGSNISIDSSDFSGNSAASSGTSGGIGFGAGVSNFSVTNCRSMPMMYFANTQSYGIVVNAGASDYYVISGNDTHGNVTGGIFNGGTGTHTVVANNLP